MLVVSALNLNTASTAATPELAGAPVRELDPLRCQLDDLVSKATSELRDSGFASEGRVEVGDPREVLVSIAQSERADLIVVGSHGRTGIAKLVLGSVSSHIVTQAPCSVLVVKHAMASGSARNAHEPNKGGLK
jgi:nucleotide-binding universal stress UspA family protein